MATKNPKITSDGLFSIDSVIKKPSYASSSVEQMGGGSTGSSKTSKMCDHCKDDHSADACPWIYTKCPVTICNGVRFLKTATTCPNKGEKFLRCQFSTCPSFQWLSEAKGELTGYFGSSSSSSNPSNTACFLCGHEGHWANSCPWKETPCPRSRCTGTRLIRTSTTECNNGKTFLTCSRCNKFHWLNDWIQKMQNVKEEQMQDEIQSSLPPNIVKALEAFCREFMKKNSM